MRVTAVCVSYASLCGAIGFRSGVEHPHPPDLVCADALGRAGHPFRTEIGCVGQDAGQHGGNMPWGVASADMCEVIGKARPLMDVSQEIGNFDQRIHLADLGVQLVGRRGNIAGGWCDD